MKFLAFMVSLLFLISIPLSIQTSASLSIQPEECALTLEFSYRFNDVVQIRVVTMDGDKLNFMGQRVDLNYSIEPEMEDNILNWTLRPGNGTGELLLTYRIVSERFELQDFSCVLGDIPKDIIERFTGKSVLNVDNESVAFIDPLNEKIGEKAREIVGQDDNVYSMSKKLYRWIVDDVRYNNKAKVYPQSAIETLEKRSGDCDEQTALFLSMARSLGVPCFYMDGYIINGNGKIECGHAWSGVIIESENELAVFPVDTVYKEFAEKRANKVFVDFDCGVEGYMNNVYNDLKYWHDSQKVPEIEFVVKCSHFIRSDLPIIYPLSKEKHYGDL